MNQPGNNKFKYIYIVHDGISTLFFYFRSCPMFFFHSFVVDIVYVCSHVVNSTIFLIIIIIIITIMMNIVGPSLFSHRHY